MAVSYFKRFGFLHIPKTGGTTLLNHFKEYLTDLVIDPVLTHSCFIDVCNAMDKNKQLRWFALVRNPYDRIYSAFVFLKTFYPTTEWCTFKEMLVYAKTNTEDHILLRPMTFFICKDDIAKFDITIYYYENFNSSVSEIASYLDIPSVIKKNFRVNHVAQECSNNSGLKYSDIYTNDHELIALINEIYFEDFKTFHYTMLSTS